MLPIKTQQNTCALAHHLFDGCFVVSASNALHYDLSLRYSKKINLNNLEQDGSL